MDTSSEKLVTIRRKGKTRLSPPGLAFPYFRDNPKLWESLKAGETIEVPADVVTSLAGIEILKKKKKKEGDE